MSKRTRKRYSEEFKRSAVARIIGGESYASVATECGTSIQSIRIWEQAAEASIRERPATKEELSEIRRLKRELRYAKEDAVILKKAMGLIPVEPR